MVECFLGPGIAALLGGGVGGLSIRSGLSCWPGWPLWALFAVWAGRAVLSCGSLWPGQRCKLFRREIIISEWIALWALRTSCARCAGFSLRSPGTSRAFRTLRTCFSLRPLRASQRFQLFTGKVCIGKRISFWPLWANRSRFPNCAGNTGDSLRPLDTLRPLLTLRASVSGVTFVPLIAFLAFFSTLSLRPNGPNRPGLTRISPWPLRPLRADCPSFSLNALEPPKALFSSRSLFPLRTLRPFRPLYAGIPFWPCRAFRAGRALDAEDNLPVHGGVQARILFEVRVQVSHQ